MTLPNISSTAATCYDRLVVVAALLSHPQTAAMRRQDLARALGWSDRTLRRYERRIERMIRDTSDPERG